VLGVAAAGEDDHMHPGHEVQPASPQRVIA
jgi:hypothetical protein